MNPTGPSVTFAQVEAAIINETYTVMPDGCTTVCQLTLYNGFTVMGSSACVSQENFDSEKGNRFSREKAIDKVWEMLGFRLADQIYRRSIAVEAVVIPPSLPAEAYPQVTLGDQVMFHERAGDTESEPMLAFVTKVYTGNCVGLTVFATNGTQHARDNVGLLSADGSPPEGLKYYARRKN